MFVKGMLWNIWPWGVQSTVYTRISENENSYTSDENSVNSESGCQVDNKKRLLQKMEQWLSNAPFLTEDTKTFIRASLLINIEGKGDESAPFAIVGFNCVGYRVEINLPDATAFAYHSLCAPQPVLFANSTDVVIIAESADCVVDVLRTYLLQTEYSHLVYEAVVRNAIDAARGGV